jgi:C4-dicarboxylate-specific signal transduction histidine kinase
MKIKTKALIILLSAILIAGGITIIVIQRISTNIIKSQVCNQLEITAKSRADHIESFLESQIEAIRQLAQSVSIEKFLSASKKDQDYIQRFDDVTRRTVETSAIKGHYHDVFVLDKNGIIIASSDKADIGKDKSKVY